MDPSHAERGGSGIRQPLARFSLALHRTLTIVSPLAMNALFICI